uniref:Uncharacterized protein n=1 Tax=Anguilla anguilla TaxID=7936 RepID=A0A0E9UPA0_ANGAN
MSRTQSEKRAGKPEKKELPAILTESLVVM